MPHSNSESKINLLQVTPTKSFPVSIFPSGFIVLPDWPTPVTIKPLNTLYSLFFWGSDLSLVSMLFCSALILIHTLESQSLKGPLHFPFSQAVSISTLIEWIVFNIGLLQQALNTRMLTQRFLFCLFSPLLPHELGL